MNIPDLSELTMKCGRSSEGKALAVQAWTPVPIGSRAHSAHASGIHMLLSSGFTARETDRRTLDCHIHAWHDMPLHSIHHTYIHIYTHTYIDIRHIHTCHVYTHTHTRFF